MKNTIKLLSLILMITLVSCGDSNKKEKEKGFEYEQPQKSGADKAGAAEESANNVTLLADDLMKYNKKEIRVKAGEKVTLTLKHTGKLDVKVMGHNFVLLKEGVDLVDFATKATAAVNNSYIPEGSEDIIVHTKLLGGGETDTIEFDAPAPGTYQFLCSFPGHYGVMQGKFIVE